MTGGFWKTREESEDVSSTDFPERKIDRPFDRYGPTAAFVSKLKPCLVGLVAEHCATQKTSRCDGKKKTYSPPKNPEALVMGLLSLGVDK